MSGGGGSSAPTTQTVNQNTIPQELMPYATQVLGQASALTQTPYQQYPGQQVADFSPLQNQAFQNIQQMQPSSQLNQATGMAGLAGLQAGNIGSTYNQIQGMGPNFYQSPNATVSGAQGQAAQMAGPQQFTGANVQQYMNPYLQTAQNQAIQNYANTLPSLGSAASQVGGLGGSREALMQAQAQQGLQQTLAGNVSNAFQNAQNQFNTSQAQQLQAGQANLGAQMQAEQQNVGNQQQANLANQQAALQQAALAAQYGLGGAQLAQQSQQFGSNLGLQGLNTQLQAAGQLGNLGQQQFQQAAGINTALLGAGSLQQQQNQTALNTGYQNYLNQLNYPYQQLQFMSGLIRGTPTSSSTSTLFQAPPTAASQVAGLGLGLGSLFGTMSDRRLKKNIRQIGVTFNGQPWYEFEYIWGGGLVQGVMADESPAEAVSIGPYGFKAVDYTKII